MTEIADPSEKEGRTENGRVASPESVPFFPQGQGCCRMHMNMFPVTCYKVIVNTQKLIFFFLEYVPYTNGIFILSLILHITDLYSNPA